jgi:cobalamin synthase
LQQQAAGQTPYILGIAVAFTYLFLVALYESLAMPLAVLFSIAIALLGAMVALRLSGLSGDLFAQIGVFQRTAPSVVASPSRLAAELPFRDDIRRCPSPRSRGVSWPKWRVQE